MDSNGRNMYVFRDGRRAVSGPALVKALASGLQRLVSSSGESPEHRALLIDLLLRSGELECALADLRSVDAPRLAALTGLLASLLVEIPCARVEVSEMLALLPHEIPACLTMSPPEGFAFYALHPLDFFELAMNAPLHGGYAAVVGIRSIGTTLSAVVTASLIKRGVHAERITVRPVGHPYERRTEFSVDQLRWIANQRSREADFLVVDEGPGMSGSSFLSVGEALLGAGVQRSRVQFLCSRRPDVNALCARDAPSRWSGFHASYAAPATHVQDDARIYIGGGYWRHELIGHDTARWPASWSQMERLKFLSPDRQLVFKFEGYGRFGSEIRERTDVLSEAGYVASSIGTVDGFGCYPFLKGEILSQSDLKRDLLDRMADYCAFRVGDFRAPDLPDSSEIRSMVEFNVAEEFGVELNGQLAPLEGQRHVLVDGRMLPHEWIRTQDGRLMKCDATAHGDDHFFPGPSTDICWDLAGAIIEWQMSPDGTQRFIDRYRSLSGDDPGLRLPAFLLAYAVFRMAYCKMAAAAMQASGEETRLQDSYLRYRAAAKMLLP